MAVNADLVAEACTRLGVVIVDDLRDGGQKVVKLVDRSGELLVLKLVKVGSSQPDALRRAHREVELLQSIDSQNVVQVRSELIELDNPVSGAAWLEEFIDGHDLDDELDHLWEWADVRWMARHVANGLAALHERGVVHRDLSPNNVRNSTTGGYKVLDPGFARHTLRSGLTVGGQPGTPGFMSPEHLQVYSGAPTASSDVFAVGILMFCAAAGRLPIEYTGDDTDYIIRLREASVPALTEIRPDYPPHAVHLIHRCMHKQAARRYRDGAALAEALGDSE